MLGFLTSSRAATAGVILLALAIPSVIAGRVPIAVALALGSLCLAQPVHVRAALAALPELRHNPVAVAAAVTLALWLVSALIAGDPLGALQVWAYVTGFVLLAAYHYRRLRDDERLRTIFLKAFVIGAVASVGLAALSVHAWWEIMTVLRAREMGSFQDAQQSLLGYGSTLPIMAVLAIYAGWRLGRRWLAAAILVVPVSVAILLGTGSTAGWLGFLSAIAAIAIGYAMARMPARRARLLALGLLLAAAAAAAAMIAHLPPIPYACEAMRIPTWAIDMHRQIIWAFSLEHAVDRPWLGWGVGTGGALPGGKDIIPCLETVEYLPSHSHNWMIELFMETGALGLTALVVTLMLYAARIVREMAHRSAAAVAAIAIAGAFWGSGLVNFSIWAAWWQWCFLLPSAVLWAETWGRRPAAPR